MEQKTTKAQGQEITKKINLSLLQSVNTAPWINNGGSVLNKTARITTMGV